MEDHQIKLNNIKSKFPVIGETISKLKTSKHADTQTKNKLIELEKTLEEMKNLVSDIENGLVKQIQYLKMKYMETSKNSYFFGASEIDGTDNIFFYQNFPEKNKKRKD